MVGWFPKSRIPNYLNFEIKKNFHVHTAIFKIDNQPTVVASVVARWKRMWLLQCKSHGGHRFSPWIGKIPWRRVGQPTPVFLPGESPWTKRPGGLQSTGLQRVRHDWTTKHSTAQKRQHMRICSLVFIMLVIKNSKYRISPLCTIHLILCVSPNTQLYILFFH